MYPTHKKLNPPAVQPERRRVKLFFSALELSLHRLVNCVVDEMFNDLMREIPHSFEVTEIASEFIAPMTPANYFSTKTTKSVSVIVTGMTGTGRSTQVCLKSQYKS